MGVLGASVLLGVGVGGRSSTSIVLHTSSSSSDARGVLGVLTIMIHNYSLLVDYYYSSS